MCGRYYVEEDDREIRRLLNQLDKKYASSNYKTREIYPSHTAPVLIKSEATNELEPIPLTWGYPNLYKKGILINARSETVTEKPTFRESVMNRRCIIPSNGYYEWDGAGYKYLIKHSNKSMLYMAGIYQYFDGVGRFVILTTEANRSVRAVHHRMPLVLEEEELEPWVKEKDANHGNNVIQLLQKVPSMLQYEEVVNG